MNETIILDTETTGVNFDQEIVEVLQLSIINENGDTLYNGFFKPTYNQSWDKAQAVNHISPEMVADCPSIDDELSLILPIIRKAKTVIGYNTQFDVRVLSDSNIHFDDDVSYIDVMRDFAPIYGDWNEERGDYKWQKLTTCADYYGYDWGTDTAHDSLADCRATLFCYQKLRS